MWTCPRCKERIEEQFDTCWKCAAEEQLPAQAPDVFWFYPWVSLTSLLALGCVSQFFWHSPRHGPGYCSLGGALVGLATSTVGVWAFLACPYRHWLAKFLTLLLLIGALYVGLITVGSFVLHLLTPRVADLSAQAPWCDGAGRRSPFRLEAIQPAESPSTPASAAFTPATTAATRTGSGKSDGASSV